MSLYALKSGFQKEIYRPMDSRRENPNPFVYKHTTKIAYPCSPGVTTDHRHGSRVIPQCGSWECEWCGPGKVMRLKQEIQELRLRHGGIPVFTVLTFSSRYGKARNYRTRNYLKIETQKQYYRKFVVEARKVLGTDAYVMIPEWQANGCIHFNIMWFGVDKESFSDCVGAKDLDLRRICHRCTGCHLRRIWRRISGATRSTHGVVRRHAGAYATKYITKSVRHKPDDNTTRRYSFSRACRRGYQIVPVYQYLYRRARTRGKWHLGVKDGESDEQFSDYLTPSNAYLGTDPKFHPRDGNPLSERHDNHICGNEHDQLCDTMVYMSPTRMRAWGGEQAMWDAVERDYGYDTVRLLRRRLATALWRSRQFLRGWKHDGDRYINVAL